MAEYDDARKKALRAEYIARINRVIDFIEANLDSELSLRSLAKVANFSTYHFHRVFKGIVGETLNQFIQRRRAEKAALMLMSNPAKPITDIAFDCGFSSSAVFARSFKEIFGVSASEWRRAGGRMQNKNRKTKSKNGKLNNNIRKDFGVTSYTIDPVSANQIWRLKMDAKKEVKIEVKELSEMHVAYIRHIGPFKGNQTLFESLLMKLCSWAGPRGLIRPHETKFMSIYHDHPDVTDEDKFRVDICMTVPEDTTVDGEIGKATVPGGKYAVGHFELLPNEYENAWCAIMGGWLPESGYQGDDRPCFEIYLNNPKEHPEGKCILDICVPVKPL